MRIRPGALCCFFVSRQPDRWTPKAWRPGKKTPSGGSKPKAQRGGIIKRRHLPLNFLRREATS